VRQPSDPPRVGDTPEGEILRRILAVLGPTPGAMIGPGDDAAVLPGAGPVVVTTDTLVHGPDFRLSWSSGFDLGFKSAAVNLADVAAMGARPTALLVALAMPAETTLDFVEDLARGLRTACAQLAPDCGVVGGDLTVSPTLTIAVTALGALDGPPVLRSGARAGDVVALAGEAGAAARGLSVLFERFTDAEGRAVAIDRSSLSPLEAACVDAQLRPRPPIALGAAAAQGGASAMMDVSDGLALDAGRLADASGVRIELDSALLGVHLPWAVTGGEDHALLATFPVDGDLPEGFRVIGRAVAVDDSAGAGAYVDGEPANGGWDPYRDWDRRGDAAPAS
jgi:thiamine-monophosphate kinase